MKPLTGLYQRITAFPNLLEASTRAQRGKRYRADVLAFNGQLEANIFRLQEELRAGTYRPGPYRRFWIRDPKPRLISAAPYRDRVVHHAICGVIVPPLERRFLRTSFANRIGYGSHRALRTFVRAVDQHRWVLQADISVYFPSIDHRILRAQLSKSIACPSTLRLIDLILANGSEPGPAIDTFSGDTLLTPLERPRGLPIGNLTSQFLANFHLDPLDHTMAALPGIGAYMRYVDDMAVFSNRREDLIKARHVIEAELSALRLRLHPSKSQLRRCRDGATFVGFQVVAGRIRVRNHNLLRGRRRLRALARGVHEGRITAEQARTSTLSWNAHLAHGHTWRLRRRLFADLAFTTGLP